MNTKRRLFAITIVLILFILPTVSCRKKTGMGVVDPYWMSRQFSKDHLGKLLQDYFSTEEKLAETTKQHFIEYAVKTELFIDFPPPQGYETEGDLSFYLIWPDGLNSKNPQLVAYTQPFNKVNEKDLRIQYRCLLFFRENEPVAIISKEGWAMMLIGNDNLKNEPDLYLWSKFPDYQRDKRQMKSQTENSTPIGIDNKD